MATLASPPPVPGPSTSRGFPDAEAPPRSSTAAEASGSNRHRRTASQTTAGTSSPYHSLDLPSLLPLSHAHPLLLSSDFDVDAFLLSRIHIPLDELRAELRAYLAELREELVQLINDDYEEFISLGTGLRGEGERLRRLQRPLGQLRGQVEVVRDVLKEHQDAVQAKLDERAVLREEKALLDLLQRLFETLTRAEALQAEAGASADGGSVDGSKVIARLAGEYTQLVYLRNKARGEGCKIADAVSPRIDVIRTRLSHDLSSVLTAALDAIPRDEVRLKQCLKTYDLVEGWAEAEEVVRAGVAAFCAATITASALVAGHEPAVPESPSRVFEKPNRLKDDGTPLVAIYNRVLAHVEGYLPLITIAQSVSDEFDFFARVFWPEIGRAITDNLGDTIFAAGRPSELHQHYTTTHRFLGLLENYAPSPEAVAALRDSNEYATFERRWQLPVYFQLRWKEIVKAYEAALAQPATPRPSSPTKGSAVAAPSPGFALPQSAAAWEAFRTCWSTDIYIPELAHRFWRLSLQIVSRYDSWLAAGRLAFKSADGKDSSGGGSGGDDEGALKFSAAAVADIDEFRRRVRAEPLLAAGGEHGEFPLALDTMAFADRIIGILQKRCAEPLKQVRPVASQLRAAPPKTTKPVASHFIPSLLKPVHVFFTSRPQLAPYQTAWAAAVAVHVFAQYAQILASVRKTEDLLRRHRKSKKSGFSLFGGNNSSSSNADADGDDDARFNRQMVTDIEALAADARGLGVDVDAAPGWAELREVAERPVE